MRESRLSETDPASGCLLAHGGGHAGFTGIFLQVFEFLPGVVESFLLGGDLFFVLCVLLVPGGGVAEAIAGVGVEGGGADLVFALQHVGFAGQQVNLVFLRGEPGLPVLPLGLALHFIVGRFGVRRFGVGRSVGGVGRGGSAGRIRVHGLGTHDGKLVVFGQVIVVVDLGRVFGFVFARFFGVISQGIGLVLRRRRLS